MKKGWKGRGSSDALWVSDDGKRKGKKGTREEKEENKTVRRRRAEGAPTERQNPGRGGV